RRLAHEVDRDRPLWNLSSMQQLISDSVAGRRFNTMLILVFAAVALGLALMGIYGVFSYAVAQRTQEIGIRMAVGASRRGVVRLGGKQSLRGGVVGVGVGIGGGLGVSGLLSALVFRVAPKGPYSFAGLVVGLGVA